jgi:hypothetical protein
MDEEEIGEQLVMDWGLILLYVVLALGLISILAALWVLLFMRHHRLL